MNFTEFIFYFTFTLTLFMSLGSLIRPRQFRNIIFSILLLCLGYMHIFLYFIHSNKIYNYPHIFFFQHLVIISIGPILYLFTLSLTGEKNGFTKNDILHFTGTILYAIVLLPYFIKTSDEKIELIHSILKKEIHIIRLAALLAIIVTTIYVVISLRKILTNFKKSNPSQQKIILLVSLLSFWLCIGIIGIVITVTLSYEMMLLANVLMSSIICALFFLDQRYPYIVQYATVSLKKKSYSRSHLDNINLDYLNKQIIALMEEEKLYCDEDLTLTKLSQVLEITQHQLSQFLNEYYKKNFNNFINSYRIKNAKELILNDPSNSILSIAFAVGFNSYSAFHRVFKKETELSPADFRQKCLIEHSDKNSK